MVQWTQDIGDPLMLWRPKVLIIDSNDLDVKKVEELLAKDERYTFRIDRVPSVEEGLESLHSKEYHAVILDLATPPYDGLEALTKLNGEVMKTPIIVLTGGLAEDCTLGHRAVQIGAQDFIHKSELDTRSLVNSIMFAVERQKRLDDVRAELFTDELTQVNNRRGFITLGQQQLKVAKRLGQSAAVLFIDVDNLKPINDLHGHEFGDIALLKVAGALIDTCRDSDIIGRLGGDEFAVFMVDTNITAAEVLKERLYNAINQKRIPECNIKLSASIGVSCYEPGALKNLLEMLADADELMYKQKQDKKRELSLVVEAAGR
jgi:two-component system, cell cycle response regulator